MKRIAVWFIAADGPVATTAQKMLESYFFGVSCRQLKIPPDDPMRASIYEALVIITDIN